MRYRYRCYKKGCFTRATFKHPLEWYKIARRCPSCGNTEMTLDNYRMKKEVGPGANNCSCDGYHFPHRKGSLWCIHATKEPTEEQYKERYYA